MQRTIIYSIVYVIGNWVKNGISSDLYANVIESIELIVAVTTIIIGGNKLSELIAEYQRKRLEATFGFYVNLGYYVKRIRLLISADDNSPLKTLYLLSPKDELKDIKGYDILGDKLSTVSQECLQYLSSKADQIPPANSEEERIAWEKTLDEFVVYLNHFFLIGSGISLPNLGTEDNIRIYFEDIMKVLSDIENKIESETKKCFIQIQSELKEHEG